MTKARLNIVSRREMMWGELYRALSSVLSKWTNIYFNNVLHKSKSSTISSSFNKITILTQLKLSNARQRPKVGNAQGVVFQDKMVQLIQDWIKWHTKEKERFPYENYSRRR